MALNEKKLERLNQLLEAFDGGAVQPNELMEAVDAIIAIIKQSEDILLAQINQTGDKKTDEINKLESKLNSVSNQLASVIQKVKDDSSLDASGIKQLIA